MLLLWKLALYHLPIRLYIISIDFSLKYLVKEAWLSKKRRGHMKVPLVKQMWAHEGPLKRNRG
jgi:hypothetical protein